VARIGADPAAVLVYWPAAILEDFRTRNAGIPQANCTNLLKTITPQSEMLLCELLRKQTSMAQEVNYLKRSVSESNSTNEKLASEMGGFKIPIQCMDYENAK
jgi:hypothetical protein